MLKKILSALGFLVIFVVVIFIGQFGKTIGQSAFAPTNQNSQQIEAEMIGGFTSAAQQINQEGPVMVDKEIRLDRAAVGPGVRLTYHYTFINYSSSDITSSWLQANIRPAVKMNVCANEKMKPALQKGGIYVYAYSGNNGLEITRFEIKNDDCTQPNLSIWQTEEVTKHENDIVKSVSPKSTPATSAPTQRKVNKGGNTSLSSSVTPNSQPQVSATHSEIPGDTNNDGILSGSEQYLRDSSRRSR
ncbi:MAG: hypothetical protein PHR16_17400 [Methylovulum sp.]|nr:hypothetical protein [Methylovulum sp.]